MLWFLMRYMKKLNFPAKFLIFVIKQNCAKDFRAEKHPQVVGLLSMKIKKKISRLIFWNSILKFHSESLISPTCSIKFSAGKSNKILGSWSKFKITNFLLQRNIQFAFNNYAIYSIAKKHNMQGNNIHTSQFFGIRMEHIY